MNSNCARIGKLLLFVQITLIDILDEELTIPSDILEELKSNKVAR
jgi:hypothetical protein